MRATYFHVDFTLIKDVRKDQQLQFQCNGIKNKILNILLMLVYILDQNREDIFAT